MVTLLIGKKGTGKTKKLISLANEAVATSAGNVVVIEKGAKLTFDVTHKARLIDTDQYEVQGYDVLYGFVCGICAGNYDVTDIFYRLYIQNLRQGFCKARRSCKEAQRSCREGRNKDHSAYLC